MSEILCSVYECKWNTDKKCNREGIAVGKHEYMAGTPACTDCESFEMRADM